ncbi:Gfo/Idh/MocA family oxidoreductase [Streptomyces longwoodensis]|uniref:Gfo/Idh/MocA family oxidoreductase n=1 Tax=Streptomyces longwoodensis TaxID=68231 RepID=UPI0033CF4ACE
MTHRHRSDGAGDMPVPVVLAGARGHGRWHLDTIRRLQDKGIVRLTGLCELTPLTPDEVPEGLGTPEQSADLGALLDATGARVAVICTPIPTHTDLALTAARRGVHLLLEKPPAPSYAAFRRMADGVAEAGVACQVGFQSLGSHAVPAIRRMLADGAVGEVTGVGGAGAWSRPEAYYRRAPWAGRRRMDGTDVVDGALTNPLAHAVATALALVGATRAEDVTGVETELWHANAIESDDTSCVRVTTTAGPRVTVAATLCAEHPGEPYVLVHGTRGRITYWYKQDRVLLQRAARSRRNARELSPRAPLPGAVWTVGAWFVLVVNFIVPRRFVLDIGRASSLAWREKRDTTLVNLWWAAWVAHALVLTVANRTDPGSMPLLVLAEALMVTAVVLLVRVVERVTTLQDFALGDTVPVVRLGQV